MEKQRSTTKERMQEVLMVLGVSASEFESKCGLAHGFVARVTRVITKKTRIKIKTAYPKLNIEYIAAGTGDIFEKEGVTQSTIKDRLKTFLDYMHIGRKEFTQRSGVSEALISNMTENLRNSSLERIYRAFPMLSPEWLEYGDGDMIVENQVKKSKDTTLDRINKVIKFLGITTTAFQAETKVTSFKENITRRSVERIVKRYPFVNPMWLMHGTGNMFDVQKGTPAQYPFAPLVSQRSCDGYIAYYKDKEYLDALDKIPYVEDEETNGNVIAIEVFGNSMDNGSSDSYQNGDIVLAKEVDIESISSARYDFVIVHKTGILIKKIIHADKYSVTLHSINTEYGNMSMSLNDILQVFVITTRISKRLH